MKYRKEIKSLIILNDLTDLKDTVHNTQQVIHNFSSVLETKIAEIETTDAKQGLFSDRSTKACPIKLPTYAGLTSEDFITFRDKFTKAAVDNKISRTDRVEKLREYLTGKALANIPQEDKILNMHGNI